MKLNQRRNQQCECDKETKCNCKVLRKQKAAKTKHPRHHHHYSKLARAVRFEDLEGYQNRQKRYARLNAFQSPVAEKEGADRYGRENHFQNKRAKPVTSWLHPEFQRQCEKKKKWDPACEVAKHRR